MHEAQLKRIEKRRDHNLVSSIMYSQNPKNLKQLRKAFFYASKKLIFSSAEDLMSRLFSKDPTETSEVNDDINKEVLVRGLNLKDQLNI